jgi:sterol desaturase/sphingolipid hydroxylase (fatty acid hydroxylase superfamily)
MHRPNPTASAEARDARGDWHPERPIGFSPLFDWPPRPSATLRWLVGMPGFLWPMNALWLGLAGLSWHLLTPPLSSMQQVAPGWVAALLLRNLVLVGLLFGGLHLHLHVWRRQAQRLKFSLRPLARGDRRYWFGDQVRDNMARTLLVGVPTITLYEALTWWLWANGHLPGLGGVLGLDPQADPLSYWAGVALMLLLAPFIHAVHFYVVHRLLHWRPLYRTVHSVHHLNVEVGPWSGLAMHPVEQLLYFSTVVVQWLLALHPVNALFQIFIAAFSPALGHSGFEKLMLGQRLGVDSGNHFHYLHHRYFDCNYGGSLVPLDRVFGSFHDGSPAAHAAMRARRAQG